METDLLETLSAPDRTAFGRALSTLVESSPNGSSVRQ